MFVHAVYFWLRPDLTENERHAFTRGVHALAGIESVDRAYIGVPADTERPIIERSYSQSLIVVFRDRDAHDVYQAHPVHERFRVECGTFWTKVLIYDSVSEEVRGK